MIKKGPFLLCFMSLLITALYAQEEPTPLAEPAAETNTEEKIADSPLRQRTEMEIKTSTLSELAAWCRTLGLSEGGTKEELIKRLREHFNLAEPTPQVNEKILTIESAQSTEYFTIDVIDEDYARLKGDVKLSLKDGDKVHKISADEILFNRTRNTITASGNVKYERTETNKTETFRGKSITVNIDNWSSIFIDGNSVMEDDGSSYLFSGSVIYRSDQDVTILRKATISSGLDDNAYWSINASKLWLLPGSDFAILNAILKVGEIPVLYIPFFYFPGDEVVFHPVIGFRSREGGFVQTTTYLIGQPKSSSSEKSSLSRIIGDSDKNEKELQGIFLRNTSRPVANPNSVSLRALLDYYVNLGTYTALEFTSPKTGILNQLDLSLGLGFTRTVSDTEFGFSPYAPNFDGNFEQNESYFFSKRVPFRYNIKFNSGISMKYGGLTWSIPYYSDPYVDSDFSQRSESMDWMNMIQQGAAFDVTSSERESSHDQWKMTGNFKPSLPILSPFVSNISISDISTGVSFMTLDDVDIAKTSPFSPNRKFFAPNIYTIYSFSGSISGTPVTTGGTQSNQNKTSESKTKDDTVNDTFNGIGVPISPWAAEDTNREKTTSTEILTPPVLSQTFTLPDTGNAKFIIDYSISPTSSSELQFMSKNPDGSLKWKTYEDVNWNESESILTSFRGNTSINFRMNHTSGLYENTVNLSGSGVWREYSYLNEEMFIDSSDVLDEAKMEEKFRQQYSQTNYTSSYSYTGAIKPFLSNPVFTKTNFQYTFKGTLVKSKKFAGGDGPELTPQWGSLKKEKLSEDIPGLNNHKLTANFAANALEKEQNISVSADLPPLDGFITADAAFRIWISETFLKYRMEKHETDEVWKIKPIDITERLNFGKEIGSFNHNMLFTPDEDYKLTYLNSSLSLWNFTADYTMTWIKKSVFKWEDPLDPTQGGKWEEEGDNELRPKSLKFSFDRSFSGKKKTNSRFNYSYRVKTSLNFDLQEHTNSNFQFTPGFNMNINKFLELTISATSQNTVIFRYFKGVSGMEDKTFMYIEGEQNNLFTDLFDSFNFFDEKKRKRSGFKMQSLNLDLTHFLGDWTATFTIKVYPHERQVLPKTVSIVSDITFLLQWKPIMEIKSDISYDGKNERWTRK